MNAILRILNNPVDVLRRWSFRRRFPGTAISASVSIDAVGSTTLGIGSAIGGGTRILVTSAASLVIGPGVVMGRDVEIAPGGSIEIGAHTTLQDRCIILGDVKIGADCIFAPNIYVSSGRHWFDVEPWSLVRDQDVVARSREESVSSPVTIDEDCWIGTNVVVLAGIRIGRGAVVGANSVITRDVDPYSIVAGAPAREIGRRLEYLPPMRISHDAPRDRPYFYAGFELSNSHAQRNELLGGLVARHQFSISLDSGNGGQVCIRIRASQASGARVRVFAQSASVGRDWGVLRFEVPSSEESRMDFQIFGNDPEVIVDSAWMEPIPP